MTFSGRQGAIRGLAAVVVVSVVWGCAVSTPPSVSPVASPTPTTRTTPEPSPSSPAPTATPTVAPTATATPAPTATAAASCVDRTFASLTDAQRIGQLFMIGLIKDRLDATEIAAIAAYHFGSVAFTAHTTIGVAGVRAITDAVQAQATGDATAGIGFLVAANQEGGLIQALTGPGFDTIPSALTQGTLAPATLEAKAARWGAQLVKAGVNFDLAPVADVVPPGTDAQNAPIGQLKREYGHDVTTVSRHVVAFIDGMTEAGVATSAKHFPGLGRVLGNTDFTAEVHDDVTTRNDPFIDPFAAAIDAGVPFVMVSLATYDKIDPDHLAVFSEIVIDGILRHDLDFKGVVISDAIGATKAIATIPPATRAIDFIDAGGDLIISNQSAPAIEMAKGLASRAAADPTFSDRIDAAALHVLTAKDAAGLLPCD